MHTLYITSHDYQVLRRLLSVIAYDPSRQRDLAYLRAELDRACITHTPAERPSTVRLGSRFEFFDPKSGKSGTFVLCLPGAHPKRGTALSVTSRFGAAVLGCSVGDEVTWEEFGGSHRVILRHVEPPSSSDTERQHSAPQAFSGYATDSNQCQ